MSGPACSVVIPSHDRPEMLDLVLAALAVQDTVFPFEVIVVLDGVTPRSLEVVERWEPMGAFHAFRWIEQPRRGQAAARNAGVLEAEAPIVLFLDDDVVPDADMISVHLSHHAAGQRIAVLGDCEVVRAPSASYCELSVWGWWEDTNHRRAATGQPASYRDFCTGNVSLRREDFAAVGGFDDDFTGYGREDYELGYRLLRSGVGFVADRRARARHFNRATIKKRYESVGQEAQGDVRIARKHPELINGLPLMCAGDRRKRLGAAVAMFLPWLAPVVYPVLAAMLWMLEQLGLRRRWLRQFDLLMTFSYWRGLRASVGSLEALRALRATALPPLTQQVDVTLPLAPQVAKLNVDVPSRLLVFLGGTPVGAIELSPTIEEPLLAWLVREVCGRFSFELLLESARPGSTPEQLRTKRQIRSREAG